MIVEARAIASRIEGRLELVFSRRGACTALTHARVDAPLKIVRPFVLDDGRALVQMLLLGPGLCGGDRTTIDIRVESGARAVVVAQSASRILGMADGMLATQTVTLTVDPDGHLEYYPGLTIPFPQSGLVQRVRVRAAEDARVGIAEMWAMGRRRRGEYLCFRRIYSQTLVEVNGTPVYADLVNLEPASASLASTGILDNRRYLACGYWVGATAPSIAAPPPGTLLAVGHAASNQVYLRALADEGHRLSETVQEVVRGIQAGWGLRPIPIGRFTA